MVAVLVDLAACPEANLEEGTLNAHMLSITWKRIRTKWARTLPEWVTRFSSASGDAGAGAGAVKAELTKARTRAKYVNGAMLFGGRKGGKGKLSQGDLPRSGDERMAIIQYSNLRRGPVRR